jgi:hypothetical protein
VSLPVIPVADGSRSGTPLCPLWRSRGGRGQGEGPEASRERGDAWDCNSRGRPSSTGRDSVDMMNRPRRAGPVKYRRGPLLGELTVPGGKDPDASRSSAAGCPAEQANQTGIQLRRRLRMAALSFHQAPQTVGATRTASSPATPAPRTLRRTRSLQEPSWGSSDRWRPDQRAPSRPGPSHRRLRTLTHPKPSQGSPTPSI